MKTKTAAPVTTADLQHQVGKFVLYEGRLGHVMGEGLMQNGEPKRWINLRVMDRRAIEGSTEIQLVGSIARSEVYMGLGRYVSVPDLWEWPVVTLEQPVPKPADGKTYTWKWTGNRYGNVKYVRDGWQRLDYPSCRECYPTWREVNGKRRSYDNVHPPAWSQADCGRCHPGGVCTGRGVCEEVGL